MLKDFKRYIGVELKDALEKIKKNPDEVESLLLESFARIQGYKEGYKGLMDKFEELEKRIDKLERGLS